MDDLFSQSAPGANPPRPRKAEASKPRNWTPSQLEAMTVTDRSVLVSAAAGSGKTSVLAERCVRLLQPTGGDPPCNIDELLVVTFTEAAAGEMRSRIEKTLIETIGRENQAGRPTTYLQQQLLRMPRAQISTIHGFCSRLIRQHFHRLGLDPEFAQLDGETAPLLLEESARELFEDRYAQDRFRQLIENYSGAADTVLDAAIRIHDTLRSVLHPQQWRNDSINRLMEAAQKPLPESQLGRQFLDRLKSLAAEAVAAAEEARCRLLQLGAHEKFLDYAASLATAAQNIADAIADGDINAARQVQAEVGIQPHVRNALPEWKAALEVVKEILCGASCVLRRHLAFGNSFLQEGMKLTIPAAEELLELVGLLEKAYKTAKEEQNVLDFADLEHYALALLRDADGHPTDIARDCHRRYRHVLVDEYQDINEVQDEILRLVSTECLVGQSDVPHTNLFCVGDVKQSVYGFRLADPTIFLRRRDGFSGGALRHGGTVLLNENFRGRGPLLSAINSIFANLMRSARTQVVYDQREALNPRADFPPAPAGGFTGGPIELHVIDESQGDDAADDHDDAPLDAVRQAAADESEELDRAEREARYAGALVRRLMGECGEAPRQVYDGDAKGYRPIRFGDIVILLRTGTGTANIYVRQLLQLGIPAYARSRSGFFEAVEVRDMLSVLDVIDNARQDIPLASVIRSPIAAAEHAEDCLADIRLFADAQEERLAFHQAARLYADADRPWSAGLRSLFAKIDGWRSLSRQRPLDELLWRIYRDTGYLAFCSGLTRGPQRVANLYELHRRARAFAASRRQGLSGFLTLLRDAAERDQVGEAAAAQVGTDTVQIMTVHGSKGLEFPVVICPDLGKRFNLRDSTGGILMERRTGLGLEVVDVQRKVRYPSLASLIISTSLRDADVAEELRVLYVALTRAKEHLILVGSAKAKSLERWQARGESAGPLSENYILGTGCSLQWLYTLAHGAARSSFDLRGVKFSEIPSPGSAGPKACASLAALSASQGDGDGDPEAAALIQRLAYRYPYQHMADIAAAQSVTALSKSEAADQPTVLAADAEDEAAVVATTRGGQTAADLLPPPAFAAGPQEQDGAAERGTATHAVLQYLDFGLFEGAGEGQWRQLLDAQVDQMIQRRQLTGPQAATLDREGILWWLSSALGQLVVQHRKELLRELPFYLSVEAPLPAGHGGASGLRGLDRIMVRGRIDAVLPVAEGAIILDYKTDRRPPPAGSPRWEAYRRQCGFYQQALTRLGVRVAGVHLVFLSARQIVQP